MITHDMILKHAFGNIATYNTVDIVDNAVTVVEIFQHAVMQEIPLYSLLLSQKWHCRVVGEVEFHIILTKIHN